MRDDSREILNGLLADWHQWMQGYQAVAGHGTSAMFTSVKSSRQYDTENDVVDATLHNTQMKSVEFAINGDERGQGAMPDPYRTSILFHARNLATGRAVWTSPRLPSEPLSRAKILSEAAKMLTERLLSVGVM